MTRLKRADSKKFLQKFYLDLYFNFLYPNNEYYILFNRRRYNNDKHTIRKRYRRLLLKPVWMFSHAGDSIHNTSEWQYLWRLCHYPKLSVNSQVQQSFFLRHYKKDKFGGFV